jgi:hypothetical protein
MISLNGESLVMLPLQRHAEQRVVEEVTRYLLKRHSQWYQNAVTTICSRTAHQTHVRFGSKGDKGMSALPPKGTLNAFI